MTAMRQELAEPRIATDSPQWNLLNDVDPGDGVTGRKLTEDRQAPVLRAAAAQCRSDVVVAN